jgi:hypothetical protein
MSGAASGLMRAYRLAVWLCPPAFRRRFADELRHDFADGLGEAARTGRRREVAAFLARSIADLLATAALQWLRTGGVVAGVVGLVGAGMTVTVAARLASSPPWTRHVAPQDEELMTLMLIAGVVLFVVVATIFLTQYLLWPRLRRGRG